MLREQNEQLFLSLPLSIPPSPIIHFSVALENQPFLSGCHLSRAVNLDGGFVCDSRQASHMFLAWTPDPNALTRTVGARSQQSQHLKVGTLHSRCLRTAWFLPLLEIFSFLFGSVCYSVFPLIFFCLFKLARFRFSCTQPRSPKRYQAPFSWTIITVSAKS